MYVKLTGHAFQFDLDFRVMTEFGFKRNTNARYVGRLAAEQIRLKRSALPLPWQVRCTRFCLLTSFLLLYEARHDYVGSGQDAGVAHSTSRSSIIAFADSLRTFRYRVLLGESHSVRHSHCMLAVFAMNSNFILVFIKSLCSNWERDDAASFCELPMLALIGKGTMQPCSVSCRCWLWLCLFCTLCR